MQVSTDLLIWNDAHMKLRAKKHHVAVLTGKVVKFKIAESFLEVFFHSRHQFRKKLDACRQQICYVLILF